jgi:transcriptional regulator with XRE-family HTH domain
VTEDAPDLAARVGARLRARRSELGSRLADVAADAGVSVSHLSAIEKGATVASLPVLARVAHAVGLTISNILEDEGRPRLTHGSIDQAGLGATQIALEQLRLRIAVLVADDGERGTAPVEVDGAHIFVHVRSGSLGVEVGGETHELHTGDSLEAREADRIAWHALQDRSVSIWATTRGRSD